MTDYNDKQVIDFGDVQIELDILNLTLAEVMEGIFQCPEISERVFCMKFLEQGMTPIEATAAASFARLAVQKAVCDMFNTFAE